jgi:hypothetical protein
VQNYEALFGHGTAIVIADDAMPLACFSVGPPSGADARQYPRNHIYRSYRDDDCAVRCFNPGALTI